MLCLGSDKMSQQSFILESSNHKPQYRKTVESGLRMNLPLGSVCHKLIDEQSKSCASDRDSGNVSQSHRREGFLINPGLLMLPCDKIFLEALLEAGGSKLLAWWIMVCNTGLAGKEWTDEKRLKKESFNPWPIWSIWPCPP